MKITVNNEKYDVELSFNIKTLSGEDKKIIMFTNGTVNNNNYQYYIGEVDNNEIKGIVDAEWGSLVIPKLKELLGNNEKSLIDIPTELVTNGEIKGVEISCDSINKYREAIKDKVIEETPAVSDNESVVPSVDNTNAIDSEVASTEDAYVVPTEGPNLDNILSTQGIIDNNEAANMVVPNADFGNQIDQELNSVPETDEEQAEILNAYNKILDDLKNVKNEVFELEQRINNINVGKKM